MGFWESSDILTAAQFHGACTHRVTKSQFLQSHAVVQHSDLINRNHTAKPRAKQLKPKGSVEKPIPLEHLWLQGSTGRIMDIVKVHRDYDPDNILLSYWQKDNKEAYSKKNPKSDKKN